MSENYLKLKLANHFKFTNCKFNCKLLKLQKENKGTATTEIERPNPPPDMIYPVDGKCRLYIPGPIREEAAEVLFQQV